MPATSASLMQTAANCLWSRPGYRLFRVPDRLQPETLWVCVRTGDRRCLTAMECESCPHWEADSPPEVQRPMEGGPDVAHPWPSARFRWIF
jgi:hypothetical protein